MKNVTMRPSHGSLHNISEGLFISVIFLPVELAKNTNLEPLHKDITMLCKAVAGGSFGFLHSFLYYNLEIKYFLLALSSKDPNGKITFQCRRDLRSFMLKS